jgi:YqaJ-like recombinase protein
MQNKPFIEPHTDEWYATRLGKVTSSKSDLIFKGGRGKDEYFGTGALTYINILIAERLTGESKEASGRPIDWGLSNEHDARLMYSMVTNQKVTESKYYNHDGIYSQIFGGTNDGEVDDEGIIEIKCPYASENHIAICQMNTVEELKKFDNGYYCQSQGNMFLTGAKWCDFISYDPRVKNTDFQIKIMRIYPDQAWFKELEERLAEVAAIMAERLNYIFNVGDANLKYRV